MPSGDVPELATCGVRAAPTWRSVATVLLRHWFSVSSKGRTTENRIGCWSRNHDTGRSSGSPDSGCACSTPPNGLDRADERCRSTGSSWWLRDRVLRPSHISSISRPRPVLFGPGRFGHMHTSPLRRSSSFHPCGRAIRRSPRRAHREGEQSPSRVRGRSLRSMG